MTHAGKSPAKRVAAPRYFFLREARVALPVRFFVKPCVAARTEPERGAALSRLVPVRPVARRLTVPSASALIFLSAAFSSLRLALRRRITLSCPSSSAQAMSVP